MEINFTHVVSMAVTIMVFIVAGAYAARKVKSAEDFYMGGRSSGVAIVSGTITGTIIGGAATMGTAQLAYSVGLSAWWFTLGSGIGLIIMALFYAKPLRRSRLDTIPQFLVMHYGAEAGPLTSIASSLGIFFSIVASIMTAVSLLSTIFGMSVWAAVFSVIFIVLCYVFFGGIHGTGLAGNLKLCLIYLTLFVAGIMGFTAMGGLSGINQSFNHYPWLSLFGRGVALDLENALSLIVGILSTQTYIQALYAARDTKTAVAGTLIAAAITIPVGLPSVAIGMFMHVNHPNIAPINALPIYIINYMPSLLGGAALAALLISAVGSAAGLALGVGTMLSRDVIGKFYTIKAAESLFITRAAVLFSIIGAALFAYINLHSLVLKWNYLSMALRGTGIVIPLTIAVFCPGRLRPKAAIYSMAAGVIFCLGVSIVFPNDNSALFAGIVASLAVAAVGMTKEYDKKCSKTN